MATYEQLLQAQRQAAADAASPRPRITILSHHAQPVYRVALIHELDIDDVLNDMGQLSLALPADEEVFGVTAGVHPDAAIPVIVELPGWDSIWFCTHVGETYEAGAGEIVLHCVSPEKHLESLYGWSNPHLAAELQVSKIDIEGGPVAKLVKEEVLAPQFARQGRKVGWQIHHVMPTVDEDMFTRFTMVGLNFENVLDVVSDLIDSDGLTLVARPYIHGKHDQPWEGADFTRSAVIWDIEQRAKLPEGGFIWRGAIQSASDFWTSFWSTLTGIYEENEEGVEGAVNYWGQPQLLIRSEQIEHIEVTTSKPTANTFTLGGNSPDWLNKGLSMGISAILAGLAPIVGFAVDILGLDGVLDDRLLAYHSVHDRQRSNRQGPFGFFESFMPSVGLSLDALMKVRAMQYRTQSNRSYDIEITPGDALAVGRELRKGAMAAVELPFGRVAVAFVSRIRYTYSDREDGRYTVQIADRPRRAPDEAVYRALSNVAMLANKVLLTE